MVKLDARIGGDDEDGVLDEIKKRLRSIHRSLHERPDRPFSVSSMRRGRIHPMVLREFTFDGPHRNPWIGVLVVASFFRDWLPWIYDLGIEAYRGLREGRSDAQEQLEEFYKDYRLRDPWSPWRRTPRTK